MRRALGAAIAIAAICVGLASTSAASTLPTLTASQHFAGLAAVEYGQSVTLSGHESLGGTRSFRVVAQQWPFVTPYRTVVTGKTSGSYSVSVKPSHATHYVILVGGQRSSVLTVYVIWKTLSDTCSLCAENNPPGTHTLVVKGRFLAPPGPIAVRSPVYFYYGQKNGSRVKPTTLHLSRAVPLQVSRHVLSVGINYTVNFPSGMPFEFAIRYCWRDHESRDGVGLPGYHGCGNKTIAAGQYLG